MNDQWEKADKQKKKILELDLIVNWKHLRIEIALE